jgi:hypothetical protein
MRLLYQRIRTLLYATGKPRVIFWWGVAFMMMAIIWIWADFVPALLSYFLSAFCAGFGMFLMMQASDLKRRQRGR